MGDKAAASPVVMGVSGASSAVTAGTPKKATPAKANKPRVKPTHPKTAEMVIAAIKALKERGGSSVQAIKKYMVSTYKIDAEKQATFIKKYLKAAVASGVLVQTKGKGAAGSFKLSAVKLEPAKPKAKSVPKTVAPKKAAVVKKSVGAKKSATIAAKKAPKKKAATTVGPEKKKKVSKGPAAKPPKAKTTKAKPAAKSPAKAKPAAANKTQSTVAKPKKGAPKKTTVSKK